MANAHDVNFLKMNCKLTDPFSFQFIASFPEGYDTVVRYE